MRAEIAEKSGRQGLVEHAGEVAHELERHPPRAAADALLHPWQARSSGPSTSRSKHSA